jgi:hypothetical protein
LSRAATVVRRTSVTALLAGLLRSNDFPSMSKSLMTSRLFGLSMPVPAGNASDDSPVMPVNDVFAGRP